MLTESADHDSKIVSEYDQEIPRSQTADNMAPRGRATQMPLSLASLLMPFQGFVGTREKRHLFQWNREKGQSFRGTGEQGTKDNINI